MNYDYIIVGGGSAGSVMANRLSAKSSNKVLLCEAGQDTPHGKVPPEILDSYPGTAYFDPRFHWTELKVHTEVISHNRPEEDRPPLRKYEQARVLGGGSSINGQLANRGAPTDYDEWEARGAAGWNWNAVLPYFKKVERDMDFDGPWHGKDGRIPVRRIFPDLWNGHAKAVAKAFEEAGFEYIQDQNGEFKDGYFPITISNLYDRRVSAAIGYLDPGTRLRSNLTISAADPGQGAAVRGHALRRRQGAGRRQGNRVPRRRGHRLVGRDPLAGASAARRHRAGRASARPRDRGRRACAGGRPAADGPSVDIGLVLHQARLPAQRPDPPAHPAGAALFLRDRRRAGRRHVRRRRQQIVLACGRRADRLVARRRLQDLFGNRPGQARLARLAGRADRRVQPAVRPARPRTADGRLPAARRDADQRGACARRPATRSRRAIPSGCARSASSTPRTR